MTDIKTMSPATGEVITKTGEIVNLVDVLGGATPVDETVYDIESYSPRTGLIIGSDGRAYDLVDLLQGGSGPSGDCVTKEELEEKFTEKLQPIQDSVSTSEGKVSAMEGKVATCESKVTAIEKKVDGMDAVSIDMVEDLQEQLDKSEAKVDALWKLNQGQTYDFKEKVETGTSDAPAGAHYMSLEEVQGETRQDNYHMGLAVDAGTVEGCAGAPIRELQMFGKTEQESTNGYQLVSPIDGVVCDYTRNYSTITVTKNGEYVLQEGTYIVHFDFELTRGTLAKLGSISFNHNSSEVKEIGIWGNYTSSGHYSKQFTITSEFEFDRCGLKCSENPDFTVVISNFMIEKGTEEHACEPFTGGIPSPNPDYPQEIQSVEEINLLVCGKNLVDISEEAITKKTGNFVFSGSEISCVSTSGWGGDYMIFGRYPARHDTTYYSSLYSSIVDESYMQGSGFKFIVVPLNDEGEIITEKEAAFNEKLYWTSYNTYYKGYIFKPQTTQNDDYVRVSFSFTKQVKCFDIGICVSTSTIGNKCVAREVMLSFSDDTKYEPFKGQMRKIVPPHPLNAVGEYADVCDVEHGVWEYSLICRKGFAEGSFTASGNCQLFTGVAWDNANTGYSSRQFDAYCSHGYLDSSKPIARAITVADSGWSGMSRVAITNYNIWKTREEFERDLPNITCIFPSPKVETKVIDPEDLAFLRELKTYAGVANVSITDQLGRDISSRFRFLRSDNEAEEDVIAPTPLYPSNLHSVRELNVKTVGKNLFKREANGYLSNINGSITDSNTISATGFIPFVEDIFISSPFDPEYPDVWSFRVGFYDEKKNWISPNTTITKAECSIKKINHPGAKYLRVSIPRDWEESTQVEYGSVATEHEPYKEQARTIIPPRPLNAIGDYKDKADLEAGKWVYETGVTDLGEYPWTIISNTTIPQNTRSNKVIRNVQPPVAIDALDGSICEIGQNYSYGSVTKDGRYTIIFKGSYAEGEVWFCNTQYDINEWKELATGKKLVYPFQEIEYEPIDLDDLAFLRSLELLPADHHITITDQDGNDVSYLLEYIIKLSEVVS